MGRGSKEGWVGVQRELIEGRKAEAEEGGPLLSSSLKEGVVSLPEDSELSRISSQDFIDQTPLVDGN